MNKNKKRFIVTIIFIILSCISIVFFYKNQQKTNNLVDEVLNHQISTVEERNLVIDELEEILNTGVYINIGIKIKINSEIGKLYAMNAKYEYAIEYLAKAISLSYRKEDNYNIAKNKINLSNIFTSLEGYKIAKRLLKDCLELNVIDNDKNNMIKEYVYINLADIYSRMEESDKSLDYLQKSLNYSSEERNKIYPEIKVVKNIIKARALLYEGYEDESYEIINEIESSFKANNLILTETYIPYLGIKSKLEFHNKNYQKAIDLAQESFQLCEDENDKYTKLYQLGSLISYLEKINYTDDKLMYKDKLEEEYNDILESLKEDNLNYMISNMDLENDKEDTLRRSLFISIGYGMYIIITLIAFYVIIRRLRKSMYENVIDGLTNVRNRKNFDFTYKKYLYNKKYFALLIIDIDYFKNINDIYGHDFGDDVLKKVAKIIKNKVSMYGNVYRYGGEEFCVLLDIKDKNEIITLAESIRIEVENTKWNKNMNVTVSIGIAVSNDGENIFKKADLNLYNSKNKGRNKITY